MRRFRITYLSPSYGMRRTYHESPGWSSLIGDLQGSVVIANVKGMTETVYESDVISIQMVASIEDDDVD